MFTGIIKEKAEIKSVNSDNGLRIEISKPKSFEVKLGDSVSCNGVCLTVAHISENGFFVDVMEETIEKTNLADIRVGDLTNLEPASRVGDRLDGHLVQGHVDCVGKIVKVSGDNNEKLVIIIFPEEFKNLVVEKGSIAVEGISLTVFEVQETSVTVSLVKFTLENTNAKFWQAGKKVNIEFDILGKYVAKILNK